MRKGGREREKQREGRGREGGVQERRRKGGDRRGSDHI